MISLDRRAKHCSSLSNSRPPAEPACHLMSALIGRHGERTRTNQKFSFSRALDVKDQKLVSN
jgi:hypothetical protein